MRLIDSEGSELQAQLKIIREAEYQIYGSGSWGFTAKCEHAIENAPTIQPEITHEQAVEYLQSTGWMQEHDRQMMLDGAHRLTAQPEPHWIPVTERLPEKSGEYLVTVKWVTGDCDVDVYEYDARHKTWNDGESAGGERAVAWRELPEPYKGVTE